MSELRERLAKVYYEKWTDHDWSKANADTHDLYLKTVECLLPVVEEELRLKEQGVAEHIRGGASDACVCEPCTAARDAFRNAALVAETPDEKWQDSELGSKIRWTLARYYSDESKNTNASNEILAIVRAEAARASGAPTRENGLDEAAAIVDVYQRREYANMRSANGDLLEEVGNKIRERAALAAASPAGEPLKTGDDVYASPEAVSQNILPENVLLHVVRRNSKRPEMVRITWGTRSAEVHESFLVAAGEGSQK